MEGDKVGLITENFNFYKRGDKYLVIFPEIPYWFVTGKGGMDLLNLLTRNDSLETVSQHIQEKYNIKQSELVCKNFLDSFNKILQLKEKSRESSNYKIELCEFTLSRDCNLKCNSCYRNYGFENNDWVLEKKYINNVLEGLKEYATEECRIGFTGGEPLMQLDLLFYALNKARSLGFNDFYIESNGMLITSEIAKKLYKLGVREVTVVLDGSCEEINCITRPREAFSNILKGIKIFRDNGLVVIVRMAIHEKNVSDIENFLRMCSEEKIFPSLTPLAKLGRAKNLNLEPASLNRIVDEIKTGISKSIISNYTAAYTLNNILINSLLHLTRKKSCNIAKNKIFIDANGDVYPCIDSICSEYFKLGSLEECDFKKIWEESPKAKYLRNISVDNFPICRKCDLKYICAGHCRALTYEEYKDLEHPFVWCKDLHDTYIDTMWYIYDMKSRKEVAK